MSLIAHIREDIASVQERDPAARSKVEVFLCYPGLWAVWIHRVSHQLWRAKWRLSARILSQVGRFFTGVDIHPGALLGRRLFIDHATGVVIGETAIVGSDVTLYQGVTLGGTGKGHGKRHPTVCDGVFVGNNANLLGNITIGENSRVGAGSVVLSDVPPNSTVVGVPAHIVYRNGERVLITDPHDIKDPLSDSMKRTMVANPSSGCEPDSVKTVPRGDIQRFSIRISPVAVGGRLHGDPVQIDSGGGYDPDSVGTAAIEVALRIDFHSINIPRCRNLIEQSFIRDRIARHIPNIDLGQCRFVDVKFAFVEGKTDSVRLIKRAVEESERTRRADSKNTFETQFSFFAGGNIKIRVGEVD